MKKRVYLGFALSDMCYLLSAIDTFACYISIIIYNPQHAGNNLSVPKPTIKHHVDTMHADHSNLSAFKMKVTGIWR